jgi:hypothetical protein
VRNLHPLKAVILAYREITPQSDDGCVITFNGVEVFHVMRLCSWDRGQGADSHELGKPAFGRLIAPTD